MFVSRIVDWCISRQCVFSALCWILIIFDYFFEFWWVFPESRVPKKCQSATVERELLFNLISRAIIGASFYLHRRCASKQNCPDWVESCTNHHILYLWILIFPAPIHSSKRLINRSIHSIDDWYDLMQTITRALYFYWEEPYSIKHVL